jgi:type IX secretion system PorP/SprF family membrane protein
LGGYIFSDHNGIMHRTGFQFAYAYHLPIEDEKQLSFGLSLSAYQYFVDINGAVIEDENDEFLANYDQVVYIPDANFGVSYTTRRFFAGFAMTNLFRGSLMIGNGGENGNSQLGHYFLTGGVKFYPGSTDWIIEPSMMLKASDMLAKSIQLDLTARVYYKDDYWLGVSYRTNDAVVLLGGVKVDRFYLGYAFDFTLSDIRSYTYGTHELTVLARFGDNPRRYRWINKY